MELLFLGNVESGILYPLRIVVEESGNVCASLFRLCRRLFYLKEGVGILKSCPLGNELLKLSKVLYCSDLLLNVCRKIVDLGDVINVESPITCRILALDLPLAKITWEEVCLYQ